MLTRSKTRKQAHEDARKAVIANIVSINTEYSLQSFVQLALHRQELAAAVHFLILKLPRTTSRLPIVKTLLSLLKDVTDLVLDMPLANPIAGSQFLYFSNLTSLTTTLPHRAIVGLLEANPQLLYLDVGPCDTRSACCPLNKVALPHVTHLAGPPGCVMRLMGESLLENLVATYRGRRDVFVHPEHFFHPTNFDALARVSTLHVDFYSDDLDTLIRIAAAVPQLTNLKLTERAEFRCTRTKSIWRSPSKWANAFQSLPKLTTFLVKFTQGLSLGISSEDDTVSRWLTANQGHPTLRHVVVWSSAREGRGSLGVWDRAATTWVKTFSLFVPVDSEDFLDTGAFV
ncbi:hypothetical protein BV25DRAFT_1921458 [Artomyces pyxidatus]|uniref:Uncharacterized protein n=1 Tax=Artomyces pyxidatus TaxID=48021 RepID=A0ACB8SHU8_9AGAM|nr:hypothetical protein BV25DRAFT_1921458 [Artomyces pyxidatus]